jgi:hypothetical protein
MGRLLVLGLLLLLLLLFRRGNLNLGLDLLGLLLLLLLLFRGGGLAVLISLALGGLVLLRVREEEG